MLSFLVDENFDHRVLEGLLLREPDLDAVSVQDAGLRGREDPIVLDWAAQKGRIILPHDVSTMKRSSTTYSSLLDVAMRENGKTESATYLCSAQRTGRSVNIESGIPKGEIAVSRPMNFIASQIGFA